MNRNEISKIWICFNYVTSCDNGVVVGGGVDLEIIVSDTNDVVLEVVLFAMKVSKVSECGIM